MKHLIESKIVLNYDIITVFFIFDPKNLFLCQYRQFLLKKLAAILVPRKLWMTYLFEGATKIWKNVAWNDIFEYIFSIFLNIPLGDSPIHNFVNISALIRKRSVFSSSSAGIFTKAWISSKWSLVLLLSLRIARFLITWNKLNIKSIISRLTKTTLEILCGKSCIMHSQRQKLFLLSVILMSNSQTASLILWWEYYLLQFKAKIN